MNVLPIPVDSCQSLLPLQDVDWPGYAPWFDEIVGSWAWMGIFWTNWAHVTAHALKVCSESVDHCARLGLVMSH